MTGSLLEPGLPRLSVPSADVGPANIADKSASKFDAALDSVIVRSFSLLLSSSLFSLLLPLLLLLLSLARAPSLFSLSFSLSSLFSFSFFLLFNFPLLKLRVSENTKCVLYECLFLQKEIKT